MKLQRQDTMRIEFDRTETNAARRLLLRLVSEFGFAPSDRDGGFGATLSGRHYAIRFRARDDGGSDLIAENAAARELIPGLANGLSLEWQDPLQAPTGRRKAVRARAPGLVARLFAR